MRSPCSVRSSPQGPLIHLTTKVSWLPTRSGPAAKATEQSFPRTIETQHPQRSNPSKAPARPRNGETAGLAPDAGVKSEPRQWLRRFFCFSRNAPCPIRPARSSCVWTGRRGTRRGSGPFSCPKYFPAVLRDIPDFIAHMPMVFPWLRSKTSLLSLDLVTATRKQHPPPRPASNGIPPNPEKPPLQRVILIVVRG
jgi:hypothetical protein